MKEEFLYGRSYYLNSMYDMALKFFDKQDCIANEVLYAPGYPENLPEVLTWLSEDGMIKIDRNGACITSKGKAWKLRGGYIGKLRRERITYIAVIIGAISGIIAIVKLFLC